MVYLDCSDEIFNDGGKWILIRIMNNIVEVVDETYISHLVMTHLRSLPDTINDVPTTLVIEYFIRTSDKIQINHLLRWFSMLYKISFYPLALPVIYNDSK